MSKTIPQSSTMSPTDGLWLVFNCDGHQIAVWASHFSGREELYVDGKLANARRNFGLHIRHCFTLNGHEYQLALCGTSLSRGGNVRLLRDGEVTQTQSVNLNMYLYASGLLGFGLAMLTEAIPVDGGAWALSLTGAACCTAAVWLAYKARLRSNWVTVTAESTESISGMRRS